MDSFNVDELLNNLFKEPSKASEFEESGTLKILFNERVRELKITPTSVLSILEIQYRTLNGILNGTQKIVDYTNLIKIADFLQKPRELVIQLYVNELEKNLSKDVSRNSKTVSFIKENFDLVALKKAGFIKSINNYREIENSIKQFFSLKSIFDYQKPKVEVAYSSPLTQPRNDLSRSMWIKTALDTFKELNNTYEYNRNALIEFFPEIRWHSKSVDLGLTTIIQKLFKMGITVVFQSPLSSLHLRGATFSVNNKPCIAITDYRGFYPTIWFALVHELFHVLFDWEEIRNNQYHISTNDEEHLSLAEKEKEADNFAREYLFSMEKMSRVKAHINDQDYIKEFAENNHVHPSFVYVFYAYDMHDAFYWSKAQKLNPKIDKLKKLLENPWDNPMPISTFINSIRHKYYN